MNNSFGAGKNASAGELGGNVENLAVRRSDVQTIADQLIESGTVLVVPVAVVEDFWAAAGQPAGGPAGLRKIEFSIAPDRLPAGARAAPITRGAFGSAVGPGTLLCLADDLPGDSAGSPHQVNGCAVVPGGVTGAVVLSSGFGGVRVRALS